MSVKSVDTGNYFEKDVMIPVNTKDIGNAWEVEEDTPLPHPPPFLGFSTASNVQASCAGHGACLLVPHSDSSFCLLPASSLLLGLTVRACSHHWHRDIGEFGNCSQSLES